MAAFDESPRRFRYRYPGRQEWRYGCYFFRDNLSRLQAGMLWGGIPDGDRFPELQWIDRPPRPEQMEDR